MPPGRSELSGTHDLGADPRVVQPKERIVDAAAAAGLADHLVPPSRAEHPLVQPFARVAEGLLEGQPFAGPEPVERDREELDASSAMAMGTFLRSDHQSRIVSVS